MSRADALKEFIEMYSDTIKQNLELERSFCNDIMCSKCQIIHTKYCDATNEGEIVVRSIFEFIHPEMFL